MGSALLLGIAEAARHVEYSLCNRSPEKAQLLAEQLRMHSCTVTVEQDACRAAAGADIVILGVKPWDFLPLLTQLESRLSAPSPLIVSLAAGVSLSSMEGCLSADSTTRLMRAMPNTPVRVGAGVTALIRGKGVQDDDMEQVQELLRPTGLVVELENEAQIHGLIALSGSSPAYFFDLLDSMAALGEELGIPRELALRMASQSMRGAALLQQESGQDPKSLRNAVTSPNGTTLAALRKLHALRVKDHWQDVLRAAHARSLEMEAEAAQPTPSHPSH